MMWDKERILKELATKGQPERIAKLEALLQTVRREAIAWTWAQACQKHDMGLDPRAVEVSTLVEQAAADLNPERS